MSFVTKFFIIIGLIVALIIGATIWTTTTVTERVEAKKRWILEHNCVVDHYIGHAYSSSAVFKCDDGRIYTWQYLPSE